MIRIYAVDSVSLKEMANFYRTGSARQASLIEMIRIYTVGRLSLKEMSNFYGAGSASQGSLIKMIRIYTVGPTLKDHSVQRPSFVFFWLLLILGF